MELIFDIGANRGAFTDRCLQEYRHAKIVLVEPNDNLQHILNQKFLNNKNITILSHVVSTTSDELIDFYISDCDVISTSSTDWINNSRFTGNYSWYPVKKQTINIDKMVKIYGTPDLLKIDVEGYELEVIKGLSEKQKEICFEWAEEQYTNINKICEHLKQIGYQEFGFIYQDEYLKRPAEFTTWEKCKIHDDIMPERKEKWGMIWVR
jgi:FkbM family methyltransferase